MFFYGGKLTKVQESFKKTFAIMVITKEVHIWP